MRVNRAVASTIPSSTPSVVMPALRTLVKKIGVKVIAIMDDTLISNVTTPNTIYRKEYFSKKARLKKRLENSSSYKFDQLNFKKRKGEWNKKTRKSQQSVCSQGLSPLWSFFIIGLIFWNMPF